MADPALIARRTGVLGPRCNGVTRLKLARMMKSKRELRAMPHHLLVQHLELAWCEWRFADRSTREEEVWGAEVRKAMAEVDRRRRRRLLGRCTCSICMDMREAFNS